MVVALKASKIDMKNERPLLYLAKFVLNYSRSEWVSVRLFLRYYDPRWNIRD